MGRRWWTFDRIIVLLQGVAGLAVVVVFLWLGLSGGGPDGTWFDRGFPFAVAAFVLVLTVWTTARGLLRARRARRP